MTNVLIFGFGNIAHAIIASADHTKLKFYVYSESNKKCNQAHEISNVIDGVKISTGYTQSYSSIENVIAASDIILFCLPSHVRMKYLEKFKNYFNKNSIYGGIPGTSGFNEEIEFFLGKNSKIFSMQRVPYISRCIENCKLVTSYKKDEIFIACNFNRLDCSNIIKLLFDINIKYLDDFNNVNLSNSNPLLHTSRIYSLLHNKKPPFIISNNLRFYEDWSEEASHILLMMDAEFIEVTKAIGLKNIIDLQTHYGASGSKNLTNKIRSINAFKGILFPRKFENMDCIVDLDSRYFKEDFEHGLIYLKNKADLYGVETPIIDKVLEFYFNVINK